MRVLLCGCLIAWSVSASWATHIIGGELFYDHLGGDQYQVSLKLYRDCGPGNVNNTQYDASVMIGVFGGDGTDLGYQTLPFPGAIQVPVDLDDPCLTAPPTICVQLAIFTGVFTLPARPDGYQLTYQRCCRSPTIVNVEEAQDQGLTCTVRIPGNVASNSSARFVQYPPIVLCLDQPLVFDHSASDADGDSLVYSLCTPYNGGSPTDAIPTPAPPPYEEIEWSAGYSEDFQMDSDPELAIDAVTGVLTARPSLAASYTVAIKVSEYRDGVLLNETRRDLRFDVVPCQTEITAQIAPQTDPCTGLIAEFDNTSPTGQTWSWDFGDPSSAQDTSSAHSPEWTYAEPGTYVVTLIANPGAVCADTTEVTYVMRVPLDPTVSLPGPVCGESSTTLVAEVEVGPGATYAWDLGPSANPQTANTANVVATFAAVGSHTVSLTVTDGDCTGSYTGQVWAYPEPTAFFTTSLPSPQAYGADIGLFDGSVPNGGEVVSWSWSANGLPLGNGISAEWTRPTPGMYQLELTVTTADGCTSTYTMPFEIIEVPIQIPNVFTPNRDGLNDVFSILNIEQHINDLTIFNRWGMPIYEASNYRNQWAALDVPDGTYYYELRLRDGRHFTGHVTLLR